MTDPITLHDMQSMYERVTRGASAPEVAYGPLHWLRSLAKNYPDDCREDVILFLSLSVDLDPDTVIVITKDSVGVASIQ